MIFSIVIPNYNSEKWIKKCLDNIKNQTFKDYEVIIIDDLSEDNSYNIIEEYIENNKLNNFYKFEAVEKLYNGGARNAGARIALGKYILFMDCDDWFYREDCLEEIANAIEENNNPDLVRLPYHYFLPKGEGDVMLHENDLKELTHSVFIAPWTKCIKRELFVPFPENTLIEDIVQHVAQMDKIETMAYCSIPVIVWNRTNENAISADNRIYSRDDKRFSSIYRNVADLIDLKVNKHYCIEEKEKRIAWYLDKIHNSKENEIVRRA